MPRYVLYQRDDCHLCDQALEVLAGVRVPVLRDATDGRELDWPFDADLVRAWLG